MTTLYCFVLVAVFISYSYQELISEEAVKKARADCQKETGIAEEVIDKAENGEFSDDKDFKCFTKCFYTQLGFVNEAGEPQVELIKENIPEDFREKGSKVIEKCKNTQGDPCEKSFQLHKCYFEEMHGQANFEEGN